MSYSLGMSVLVLGALVLIILAALGCQKPPIRERCESEAQDKIEDKLKDSLHDPGSYEHDFTFIRTLGGSFGLAVEDQLIDEYGAFYEVTVNFRAKNAFGALRKVEQRAIVEEDCTWIGRLDDIYRLYEIDRILWESRQ